MAKGAMKYKSKKRIGELLIERGFITEKQLQQALKVAKERNIKIGEALFSIGALNRDCIYWMLGSQMDMNYLELSPEMVDEELMREFPIQVLSDLVCVPLYEDKSEIHFAIADPTNCEVVKRLQQLRPEKTLRLHLALPEKIKDILKLYGAEYYQPQERRKILHPQKKHQSQPTAIRTPHLTIAEQESYWQNFVLNLLSVPSGKSCWCYKTPDACELVSQADKGFESIRHYPLEIYPIIYERITQMATPSGDGGEAFLFLQDESIDERAAFLTGNIHFSNKHIIWFQRLPLFSEEEFLRSHPRASDLIKELRETLDKHNRLLVGCEKSLYIKECFYSLVTEEKAYSDFPPSVFVEREIGVYFPKIAQLTHKAFNALDYLRHFREKDLPFILYEAEPTQIARIDTIISTLFAEKWQYIVISLPFASMSEMQKSLMEYPGWREGGFKSVFIQDNHLNVIREEF